jgi:hypothetical protein
MHRATIVLRKIDAAGRPVRQIELCDRHADGVIARERKRAVRRLARSAGAGPAGPYPSATICFSKPVARELEPSKVNRSHHGLGRPSEDRGAGGGTRTRTEVALLRILSRLIITKNSLIYWLYFLQM